MHLFIYCHIYFLLLIQLRHIKEKSFVQCLKMWSNFTCDESLHQNCLCCQNQVKQKLTSFYFMTPFEESWKYELLTLQCFRRTISVIYWVSHFLYQFWVRSWNQSRRKNFFRIDLLYLYLLNKCQNNDSEKIKWKLKYRFEPTTIWKTAVYFSLMNSAVSPIQSPA